MLNRYNKISRSYKQTSNAHEMPNIRPRVKHVPAHTRRMQRSSAQLLQSKASTESVASDATQISTFAVSLKSTENESKNQEEYICRFRSRYRMRQRQYAKATRKDRAWHPVWSDTCRTHRTHSHAHATAARRARVFRAARAPRRLAVCLYSEVIHTKTHTYSAVQGPVCTLHGAAWAHNSRRYPQETAKAFLRLSPDCKLLLHSLYQHVQVPDLSVVLCPCLPWVPWPPAYLQHVVPVSVCHAWRVR